MTDRTRSRSVQYQYRIAEIPTDLTIHFEHIEAPEESGARDLALRELQAELMERFWSWAPSVLTARQWQVLQMVYREGRTQKEVAKILDCNQSSIVKSISGNCDYRNGRHVYGGALPKLRRLAMMEPGIRDCLSRISELQGGEPLPPLPPPVAAPVPVPGRSPTTPTERREDWARRYAAGESVAGIAAADGADYNRVYFWCVGRKRLRG